MRDFLLKPEHLKGMRVTTRRSPTGAETLIKVYWRKDIEAKALEVWGSKEALDTEINNREEQKLKEREFMAFYRSYVSPLRKKIKKVCLRVKRIFKFLMKHFSVF